MGRRAHPYYRTSHDAWYATVDGKRRLLARGKDAQKEAERAFKILQGEHAKRGDGPRPDPVPTTGELVVGYLMRLERRVEDGDLAPTSHDDAVRRLSAFGEAFARKPADRLTPADVEDWLSSRAGWGPTTRHDAAGAIRAVFRWAVRGKRLASDPLAGLEKPARARRREVVMGAADWPQVRSAIRSWDFLFLCEFLHGTGCRPGEAFRLEARHVDWDRGVAALPGKQTRRTGRLSLIALPEDVLAWLLPLCEARPEGPVFRTATGRAWCKDSVNCQIRGVRRRLGVGREAGVFAQALRHLFATDALDRGVPVATVSTLLNHADTRMVMRHYSHLSDNLDHIKRAVERVRPGGDGPSPSSRQAQPPRPASDDDPATPV